MRIISGKYRGKKLRAPKTLPVRPTTDMAKESLFNILNNYYFFDGVKVLDLFAGTGNVSLEFASRGAELVTAVDIDSGCIKFIEKMSDELQLEDFNIVKEDVFKFLNKTNIKANIIFADPPYAFDQEEFESIPITVFRRGMLEDGGMLIVEHFSKMDLSHLDNFSFKRKYGSSIFSFFELPDAEEEENKD
jgi:16S rRNA (guanine(966)-N(2))-methyltransferase RsmD